MKRQDLKNVKALKHVIIEDASLLQLSAKHIHHLLRGGTLFTH